MLEGQNSFLSSSKEQSMPIVGSAIGHSLAFGWSVMLYYKLRKRVIWNQCEPCCLVPLVMSVAYLSRQANPLWELFNTLKDLTTIQWELVPQQWRDPRGLRGLVSAGSLVPTRHTSPSSPFWDQACVLGIYSCASLAPLSGKHSTGNLGKMLYVVVSWFESNLWLLSIWIFLKLK